jgi:hypothetical protein
MSKFRIGNEVRQLSTGGTGKILGMPSRLLPTDKQFYRVLFNAGVENAVPEEDLESFRERRMGNERRKPVIVKYEGQCVIESLGIVLRLPVDEVRKMFDESLRGRQNPSDINQVLDVLMDEQYVVGQIHKSRAEQKGERCFVAPRNSRGDGHAIAVLEDNTIFDPEHRFNETGGLYGQAMVNNWEVLHVLVFRKLEGE